MTLYIPPYVYLPVSLHRYLGPPSNKTNAFFRTLSQEQDEEGESDIINHFFSRSLVRMTPFLPSCANA